MTIRIAIIGASGYTGAELIEILASHPGVELAALFASQGARGSSSVPRALASVHPRLRQRVDLPLLPWSFASLRDAVIDVVFLATPAAVSAELAPAILASGAIAIDLSGAHRLHNSALRAKHYGDASPAPSALDRCAYGLPELSRDTIAHADMIACAGCYATAVSLALAPIVREQMSSAPDAISVTAVSGVSGAGRTPTVDTHLCEASLRPYAPLTHRHQPEIEQTIGAPIAFTPHIAPFDRGIVATAHVQLAPGVDARAIEHALDAAYTGEPCIRLLETGDAPSVANVCYLDVCDISVAVDETRRIACVMSALDNLRKGAAGQAVQCMNIRLGLPETAGLRCSGAMREAPA